MEENIILVHHLACSKQYLNMNTEYGFNKNYNTER